MWRQRSLCGCRKDFRTLSLIFILLGLVYVEQGWLGTVGRDYFSGGQTAPLFVTAQTNITTAASPAEPRQSPHPGNISEMTCLGLEGDLKSGREREAR